MKNKHRGFRVGWDRGKCKAFAKTAALRYMTDWINAYRSTANPHTGIQIGGAVDSISHVVKNKSAYIRCAWHLCCGDGSATLCGVLHALARRSRQTQYNEPK